MKDPFNQFLQSVKVICPKIRQVELAYMEEGLIIKKLKPKHFFIQANTIQKEIGYLFEGLIRSFYIDDKGNEITVNFIREENYATHYSAFITQQPCKYNFQCLEPTIAVCLNYDYIQEGYKNFPNIERYGRLSATAASIRLISSINIGSRQELPAFSRRGWYTQSTRILIIFGFFSYNHLKPLFNLLT